jgi:hypothetical protein
MFSLFRRKRPVVRPLWPMLSAMRRKDSVLYSEIAHLPVAQGVARWRQSYPEDFEDGTFYVVNNG